ncbi:dapper homolog 1 [Sinocyclocheilus rhinocerous]|uniref:Dapper homolog 1 n=1 Tax=Sinocyclocheilus rhinocerous TaxID=307959 RepID=A0A673MGM5_9TELE|nr:PREDICTED: dapper homolog 1 [Sinocyclocheilus rhinocerous]
MNELSEMLLSRDYCALVMRDRKECEARGEVERVRTRERLDATVAGLTELEYLRQRQELLVRSVLNCQELAGEDKPCLTVEDSYLNTEEKLLEENILLLRKQLNCLRRRDAGLINQLQELDRQISDLRLDTETSHEHVETDSRPSSGFYDLSDGASGSLSNSSNSVFSECLSSCRSTTCLCTPLDTSLCASEGRLKPADELGSCAECDCHCEDSSSGTVRRSLSASYSPSPDGSCDGLSKCHCDLIAKNGNDVYRYPSPLHAVAVQSPIFFQSTTSHLKDDCNFSKPGEASSDEQKPEQVVGNQNSSWHASQTLPNKKLDSYIFGLLQRRAQPLRTNKPRTSINTDPSKSILRQASLCSRAPAAVQAQQRSSEFKPNWQTCLQDASATSTEPSTASPQRQWSAESKGGTLQNGAYFSPSQPQNGYTTTIDNNTSCVLKKKVSGATKGQPLSVASKNCQDLGSPNAVSSPKFNKHSYYTVEDNKSGQQMKASPLKRSPKAQAPASCGKDAEQLAPELLSLGSSSQSQDEGGQLVSAQYIPAQKQNINLRKGGTKNIKIVKVKNSTSSKSRPQVSEHVSETVRDKHRTGSRRSRQVDDVHHLHRSSKKASTKAKRIPASIPEGRILEKHTSYTGGRSSAQRHHGHHRHHEAVLAKPKYKRNDYHRRPRGLHEIPYEEAFKRAHRRQKREMLGHMSTMYLPSNAHYTSPYAYVGSDSEYSAECASLFHSTILDTSEDERSNYTTNCFGDSESSASEADYVAESSTSSDSEGSAGVNWPQFNQVGTGSHGMTSAQAKAFVKIKASHNLKKKILRFRSGSLKLMTTV